MLWRHTGRRARGEARPRRALRRGGVGRSIAGILLSVVLMSCGPQPPTTAASPSTDPPPCGLWVAIGDSPSPEEINAVGGRYQTVVLNAWDVDKMRLLRTVNPGVKVLVYKDLSSTRSYPGALDDGKDAAFLPTGVGYMAAESTNQDWFAHNANGDRIEWTRGHPRHWQMAVWDPGYQQAWVDNVTAEVTREGWDGVFADNDFAYLHFYSNELVAGTTSSQETDQRIRDGLDGLVTAAGQRLNAAGKILVPNISDSRFFPGRWTQHSQYGGGMEENFAQRVDADELLTVDTAEWTEMLSQQGPDLTLLVTHGSNDSDLRTGFVAAALAAGDRTCWTPARDDGYKSPEWIDLQNANLGNAVVEASRDDNGVWHREFSGGWVALNSGNSTAQITAPDGMRNPDGTPAHSLSIPPGEGVVLIR